MNWQLVTNVEPPENRLILIAFNNENEYRDASFARYRNGTLYLYSGPRAKYPEDYSIDVSELTEEHPVYWTLFVFP